MSWRSARFWYAVDVCASISKIGRHLVAWNAFLAALDVRLRNVLLSSCIKLKVARADMHNLDNVQLHVNNARLLQSEGVVVTGEMRSISRRHAR